MNQDEQVRSIHVVVKIPLSLLRENDSVSGEADAPEVTATVIADNKGRKRTYQHGMGCLAAAERVLRESRSKALHVEDLTRRMLRSGYWPSQGKTPMKTVSAAIETDIRKHGLASRFKKVAPNTFALNE